MDTLRTLAELGVDAWQERRMPSGLAMRVKQHPEHAVSVAFMVMVDAGLEHHPDGAEVGHLSVLFHGRLSYDGLKELHMGHDLTDNVGYVLYPDVSMLAAALAAIRALELEFCDASLLHWKSKAAPSATTGGMTS